MATLLLFPPGLLQSATLPVPNGSFELPATVFVSTVIDSWQKTTKPAWYDESGGYSWQQLTGIFKNTPTNSSDHIDNCDGNQAAWLFAVPEVGLFQDFNSTAQFSAVYEVGKVYRLEVGVIGGGGGMLEGASLELSLYYTDAASNRLAVAAVSITNSPVIFSNTTHLLDFPVQTPAVRGSDPWAGKHVGVEIVSLVTSNLAGGYWDLDNARLTAITPPLLSAPGRTNGQFQFTLQSEPGAVLEIIVSPNATLPSSNWTKLMAVTNATGSMVFTDPATISGQRFYQARQIF